LTELKVIEEDTHEKREVIGEMTKRSMKSRNGEISDVVYVQLTIVCVAPRLKSKVELFCWMDGRARDVPEK
jgi:hypothetical protein